MSKEPKKNKPGQGRKPGKPTVVLNFRVDPKLKEDAKSKFPKDLNRKMTDFLTDITYRDNNESI